MWPLSLFLGKVCFWGRFWNPVSLLDSMLDSMLE